MLTNKEPVQLRIHLEDWDGNRTAIVVNEFKISNEQHGYRIFYKNFKVQLEIIPFRRSLHISMKLTKKQIIECNSIPAYHWEIVAIQRDKIQHP